jgi:hypothetical protein
MTSDCKVLRRIFQLNKEILTEKATADDDDNNNDDGDTASYLLLFNYGFLGS